MKFVLQKRNGALVPVDDEGFEILAKIRDGREVMCEITQSRNPKHHRLFFAILKFMVEHTDIDSIERAKNMIKIATGHVDDIIASNGNVHYVLRSINWESMGQDEFSAFFDKAVDKITTRWLPEGTSADDVRREIIALCDGPMMRGIEDHRR